MDDIEVTMDASSNEHADDDYNTKIHEHIACYDNIISPEMCREIIDYFEETLTDGSVFTCRDDYSDEEWNELPDISRKIIDEGAYSDGTTQFDQSQLGRKDDSLFLNITSPKYSEITFEALQKGFEEYTKVYPLLRESTISSTDVKMQRTPPGGGYHVWHDERAAWGVDHRQVVWMIYLNDMPEGEAETEFYYQKLRINPKAGRLVLWPAAYTHAHRGNIVFSQNKYVLTGWFSTFPN
jgi:hypothetical protein